MAAEGDVRWDLPSEVELVVAAPEVLIDFHDRLLPADCLPPNFDAAIVGVGGEPALPGPQQSDPSRPTVAVLDLGDQLQIVAIVGVESESSAANSLNGSHHLRAVGRKAELSKGGGTSVSW